MWYLKKGSNIANITYLVIEKTYPYKNGNKRCPPCLAEKYHVIFQPFKKLNKRSEMISLVYMFFALCNNGIEFPVDFMNDTKLDIMLCVK